MTPENKYVHVQDLRDCIARIIREVHEEELVEPFGISRYVSRVNTYLRTGELKSLAITIAPEKEPKTLTFLEALKIVLAGGHVIRDEFKTGPAYREMLLRDNRIMYLYEGRYYLCDLNTCAQFNDWKIAKNAPQS